MSTSAVVHGDIEEVLTTASTPSRGERIGHDAVDEPNLIRRPSRSGAWAARAVRARRGEEPLRLGRGVRHARRDGLDQREEAEERIGARHAVGADRLAGGRLDRDGVEPLDVRDAARGDVADLSLERGGPLVLRVLGPDDVEREHHVGPGVARALAHDELPDGGALAPVDVARILAVPK